MSSTAAAAGAAAGAPPPAAAADCMRTAGRCGRVAGCLAATAVGASTDWTAPRTRREQLTAGPGGGGGGGGQ